MAAGGDGGGVKGFYRQKKKGGVAKKPISRKKLPPQNCSESQGKLMNLFFLIFPQRDSKLINNNFILICYSFQIAVIMIMATRWRSSCSSSTWT
jgi:hypothetical protein